MCAIEIRRQNGSIDYCLGSLRISGSDPNPTRTRKAVSTETGFIWHDGSNPKIEFKAGDDGVLLEESGIILMPVHRIDAINLKVAIDASFWRKKK